MIFSSKLTTSADKSLGILDRIFFRQKMQAEGKAAALDLINRLGMSNSQDGLVKGMAWQTISKIKQNNTAQRSELDRLLLSACLRQPELFRGGANWQAKRYGRARAEACLLKLLPPNSMNRDAKALLYYATNRLAAIDAANFKRDMRQDGVRLSKDQSNMQQDGIMLRSALASCTKILPKAIDSLPNDDPTKQALNVYLANLKNDLAQLDPLLPGTQQ